MAFDKINEKLKHENNSKEKTHQFRKQSRNSDFNTTPLSQDKYTINKNHINKLEFVSRIYKVTGIICEI